MNSTGEMNTSGIVPLSTDNRVNCGDNGIGEEQFTDTINLDEGQFITDLDVDTAQTSLLENLDQMELHLECDDEPNIYVASVDNDVSVLSTSLVGKNVSLHISFSNSVVPKRELNIKKSFTCFVCHEKFKTEAKFYHHMLQKHKIETPFQCEFCSYSASCQKLLVKHKKRRHCDNRLPGTLAEKSDKTDIGINEDICDKSSIIENVVMKNSDKNNKSTSTCDDSEAKPTSVLTCIHCDASFKQKKSYDLHLKRHAKDFSFQCDQCNKMFVSNVSLKRHLKTHKEDRPFVCQYHNCEKRFKIRSALTDHIRYVHRKSENGTDAECPKDRPSDTCIAQSNVKKCERKFCCTVSGCNKYFRDMYNLRNHVATHSGKKDRKCPYCDFVCVQKTSLDWHVNAKHNKTSLF